MHENSAVGMTEVKAEAGLNQGSARSPFFIAAGSDRLADEARQVSPWTMLFADDIVVCKETREVLSALRRKGMEVSQSRMRGTWEERPKVEEAFRAEN